MPDRSVTGRRRDHRAVGLDSRTCKELPASTCTSEPWPPGTTTPSPRSCPGCRCARASPATTPNAPPDSADTAPPHRRRTGAVRCPRRGAGRRPGRHRALGARGRDDGQRDRPRGRGRGPRTRRRSGAARRRAGERRQQGSSGWSPTSPRTTAPCTGGSAVTRRTARTTGSSSRCRKKLAEPNRALRGSMDECAPASLGPLRVETADGSQLPSGGRPRDLLAALLLRRGRPVPADVLLELVWSEQAASTSASPPCTLSSHASGVSSGPS